MGKNGRNRNPFPNLVELLDLIDNRRCIFLLQYIINLPVLIGVVITHPSSRARTENASMSVARITGGTREDKVPAEQITFTLRSVLDAYRGHASVVIARNPGISRAVLTLSTVPTLLIDESRLVLALSIVTRVSTCKETAAPFPPSSFTFLCRTIASLRIAFNSLHVLTYTY